MKLPLTYREKALSFETGAYLLLLFWFLYFLKTHAPGHSGAPLAAALLMISYFIPTWYFVAKIHTTDDTRTDERDKEIEARGARAAYRCLAFGVFVIIYWKQTNGPHIIDELFLLWMLQLIVRSASQLRFYAGHESWWPDSFVRALRERGRKRMEKRFSWKTDA